MTDTILTWEELLEEDQAPGNIAPAPQSSIEVKPTDPSSDGLAGLPAGVELPPEVKALFEERETLERRMKVLSGQTPAEEDAYIKAKFPVKVHTKESRLEERRLRLRDDQRRVLTKQRLEQTLIGKQREMDRLRAEQARREETRHRLAEAHALQMKRQRDEEWVRAEEARRRKEAELQRAKRAEEEEVAQAEQARRLKEAEVQRVKREQEEEAARAEQTRRAKEAELLRTKRWLEDETARSEAQRRLKEAELQRARRLQDEEIARANEQRRLKEAELARNRTLRIKETETTLSTQDIRQWKSGKAELQQWEEARARLNERVLERRKNERREERRKRAE